MPLVDAWVAHVTQVLTPGVLAQMSAQRKAHGAELYIYNNGVPIVDLPGARLRTFPWQIWRTNYAYPESRHLGLMGSLSWYTVTGWGRPFGGFVPPPPSPWDCANQQPWCDAPASLPNRTKCHSKKYDAGGWGFLLYPAEQDAPNLASRVPMPNPPSNSVRWELFAQGLADSEYFFLLDRTAEDAARRRGGCGGNHSGSGGGGGACCKAVAAARGALDAVGSVVWNFTAISQFGEVGRPFSTSTSLLHEVKDNVAMAIEGVQRGCI